MGNIDPDANRWHNEDRPYDDEPESNSEYLNRLWDDALEAEPSPPPIPRPSVSQQAHQGYGQGDPWAAGAPGGYSDEPPF